MTHFGAYEDVERAAVESSGRGWTPGPSGRGTEGREAFIAGLRSRDRGATGAPSSLDTYVQAASPDQLYAGLERYWRKRAESVR